MPGVFLYANCSLTKRAPAAPRLQLRSFSKRLSLETRHQRWARELDEWAGEKTQALDLYAGGHWSVIRALAGLNQNLKVFVVSAGYGLASVNTELVPYSATFSAGSEDAVARSVNGAARAENRAWWKMQTEWSPRGAHGPRSFEAAVATAPNSAHLVVLSPAYLNAVADDLSRAQARLAKRGAIVLFSIAAEVPASLRSLVVETPGLLQSKVGGSLSSLGARVVAEILNSVPAPALNLAEIREFVAAMIRDTTPRPRPQRAAVTDAEVVSYLRRRLSAKLRPSYSSLLREFRASGRACEMKRFRELYASVFHTR